MSSDLLASTLCREGNCQALGVRSTELLDCMADGNAQIVVIGADLDLEAKSGFDLACAVRRAHPTVPIVMLLSRPSREAVMSALRSGARGIFSRERPIAEFVSCMQHVREGHLWVGAEETTILLELLRVIQSPEVVMADEPSLLTVRELDVVKCVLRGMTNKAIARELRLSEHTVKNYLFRIFEKLEVSNRVELLIYLGKKGHIFGASPSEAPDVSQKAG
ncbi:MAG TPA: response regulator transcription factor [Terracidiphilus sp.]|nr:response regulator transcription factor [Terracidiphilus sp.]